MRKLYIIIILIIGYTCPAFSQTWLYLGPNDHNQPSYYQADYTAMAIAPDGAIYTAYKDGGNSNKVTVSKYSSGTWSIVGTPGFSSTAAEYLALAVAGDGTPYIVYQSINLSDPFAYDATVMKFSAGSWSVVGGANMSQQAAFNSLGLMFWPGIDIAIGPAPDYIPYVAYQDYNFAAGPLAATVKKFQDESWQLVGAQGFTNGIGSQAYKLAFTIAPDGVPYILFEDNSGTGNNETTVMNFTGLTWELVGGQGFSNAQFAYPSIAITPAPDYAVYVAYRDGTNGDEATAMRFNGVTWETLGVAGFSDVDAENVSITVTSGGTPYVGYKNVTNNKARVQFFNGVSWVDAISGSPDVSTGAVQYTEMAMAPGNVPHIIYRDAVNNLKATVKKLNGSWVTVGNTGFSQGAASNTSGALRNDGKFYVAYRDVVNGNKATVKSYNSSVWSTEDAPGFSDGAVEYVSLAINPVSGDPYVGFRDVANGNEASVYYLAPDGWAQLGLPAFSAGSASYTSLAFASNGTPYIAFSDAANSNEVTVMTYNGSAWVNVGVAGFSNTGSASYVSLAVAPDGTPYVAYQSTGNAGRVSVMRFSGGTWVSLGLPGGISTGIANYISLNINSTGTAYIAYQNGTNGKAIVKSYNGSSWVNAGAADFSDGAATYLSIDFDNMNVPVVGYRDVANGSRLTVKKLISGVWTTQGSQGISAGAVTDVSLSISNVGLIYVAYSDGYAWGQFFGGPLLPVDLTSFTATKQNTKVRLQWQTASEYNSDRFILEHSTDGSHFSEFGSVRAAGFSNTNTNYSYIHQTPSRGINYYRLKQFDIDGNETIYPVRTVNFAAGDFITFSIYPNPAKNNISLNSSAAGLKEVFVINAAGQKLIQKKAAGNQQRIDLDISSLVKGVYFMTVYYTDGQTTLRFIKD